jgi:predicted enzyme related to lactoylglutathione lyase
VKLLGLRTVIYPVSDLAEAKCWWTALLGQDPYFDQPFYVGYSVGGYELALDPNGGPEAGPVTYWGVEDVDASVAEARAAGATVSQEPTDVGNGIRVAAVRTPHGGTVGLIFNPHFSPELPAV